MKHLLLVTNLQNEAHRAAQGHAQSVVHTMVHRNEVNFARTLKVIFWGVGGRSGPRQKKEHLSVEKITHVPNSGRFPHVLGVLLEARWK